MNSNTSEPKYTPLYITEAELQFLMTLNSLQMIIGISSNCFVILTFLMSKQMRKRPSDLLILNLAAADLIILTAFLPWLTYIISEKSIKTQHYFYYEGLNTVVQLASGHAVFLIALDRFLAVKVPLKYSTWVRRNPVYQSVALSWLLAVAYGIINILSYELHFYVPWLLFWILVQLLLLLSITLIYAVIFLSSFKQGRKVWRSEVISRPEDIRHRMMLKITVNTFILVCFFYATFLPTIIYIAHFSVVVKRDNSSQMRQRAWIYSFGTINCCFNPIFYVFRTERFKQVCNRLWLRNSNNNGNFVLKSTRAVTEQMKNNCKSQVSIRHLSIHHETTKL